MFEIEPADVRPSLANLVVVTGLAVVGIVLLKIVLAKYPVPGLSDLIGAV